MLIILLMRTTAFILNNNHRCNVYLKVSLYISSIFVKGMCYKNTLSSWKLQSNMSKFAYSDKNIKLLQVHKRMYKFETWLNVSHFSWFYSIYSTNLFHTYDFISYNYRQWLYPVLVFLFINVISTSRSI